MGRKPLSTAPTDHLLAMVLDACRAGQHERAETLCQDILARRPHHLDATHLLAVLAAWTGKAALGERLLNQAVALEPRPVRRQSDLVTLLRTDRSFAPASAVYESA